MGQPIRLLLPDGAASKFVQRIRSSPESATFQLIVPDSDAESALLAAAGDADAILSYQAAVPASIIESAPALRLIQKHGLNCRNIDVAAATARLIPVATVPLMRNVTVAEHALALMLACARKVIPGHHAVSSAAYRDMGLEPVLTTQRNYRANWAGIKGVTELFNATVGIVGMGDIGMEIARRCQAFGMSIAYFQRKPHSDTIEKTLGVRYLQLDDLLSQSDYVVLVIPHTPESDKLIAARQLQRMKPSACLINVGRGGLVDEASLADALEQGVIAMAGLDVYPVEPLPDTSRLRTLPNVVLLPHTGGGSYRSWEIDIPASLGNIRQFFVDGRATGVINR